MNGPLKVALIAGSIKLILSFLDKLKISPLTKEQYLIADKNFFLSTKKKHNTKHTVKQILLLFKILLKMIVKILSQKYNLKIRCPLYVVEQVYILNQFY